MRSEGMVERDDDLYFVTPSQGSSGNFKLWILI